MQQLYKGTIICFGYTDRLGSQVISIGRHSSQLFIFGEVHDKGFSKICWRSTLYLHPKSITIIHECENWLVQLSFFRQCQWHVQNLMVDYVTSKRFIHLTRRKSPNRHNSPRIVAILLERSSTLDLSRRIMTRRNRHKNLLELLDLLRDLRRAYSLRRKLRGLGGL